MTRNTYLVIFAIILTIVAYALFSRFGNSTQDSTLEAIRARGELRVGFEAGYMPFEMIDRRSGVRQNDIPHGDVRRGSQQQANFMGFDIDMAREMANDLGVEFVPVETAWPNLITSLNANRFDIIISGMSITEERQKRLDFTESYMTIGQTVLLNKKHAATVQSYEDLNNSKYVVTSQAGTTGEEAIKKFLPQANYTSYNTADEGALAVLSGEIDAFIYDHPFNATFIALHGSDTLVFLDDPFTTEQLAWAIKQNDPTFSAWLNDFLETIHEDGRYNQIYSKWFEDTAWMNYVR